jgi:CheY-like chemotaxis protein
VRVSPPEAAPHAPRHSQRVSPADGAHLKRRSLVLVTGRKLLLADDSATIQKVVDLTFSDEGLEVITVSDGQQALEKLDEVVPDIVLADVFMPGLNGYQVCEHIKRTERFRHIPVMLLVGSFEPFDEAEARRVGADDYLTKPFQSIRTLISKVGNLLSGGGGSSAEEATTRRLAPPPEAEKENRPDADFIERSTADTAPLPQHEREEMERTGGGARNVSFSDLSMDDEMIETMPGNDYGSGHQTVRDLQQARPTAQYSAADLKEAGITAAMESADATEKRESVGTYAPAQVVEPSAAAAGSQQQQQSSHAGSVAGSDDSLLDLGDLESPQALSEADDFFLDLFDESPVETRASSSPSSFVETSAPPVSTDAAFSSARAEEMDASARVDYEEETREAQPQAQEFVEAQVLGDEQQTGFAPIEGEAPPIADYQFGGEASVSSRGEFTADMQSAPTERLSDDFRAEVAQEEMPETESGAAVSAPQFTGQITLEQLSPEVIDAIARRAVEQLSERVIEQIAWEVVPDLAERLIKRRMEEEKK